MRKPSAPIIALWVTALLAAWPAFAQEIEEEDLADTELETAPGLEGPSDDAELRTLFEAAEAVFFTAEDPAVGLEEFNRFLDVIEARRRQGELSDEARGFQVKSLAYRAELLLESKQNDDAEADLGRILELDPQTELDPESFSPELVKELAKIRKERIGELVITVDPPDLDLKIDGRAIALNRPVTSLPAGDEAGGEVGEAAAEEAPAAPETVVTLLAGIRLIEASRPGYAPVFQEVEVVAGKQTPYEAVLERISAVIRLHSRPRDADVTVDGVPYGATAGVAGDSFVTADRLGRYKRDEFSGEFLIPDVETGFRVLEVKKQGYRPYRAELRIAELRDYEMPPIVLEQERGTLVFRDLPGDATLEIDGRRVPAEPRLSLEPGEHHVQVTQGSTRMFATRINLADRQTVEVRVRLRPGLAFLGVLGAKNDDLARALRLGLGDSDRWSLLDRSREAPEVLSRAGLDVDSARRAAAGDSAAVDWARVQTAVDAQAPGLVYVAAVVADDLLAAQADVWIWAAAPGPARPDRLRLDLSRQAEIDRLHAAFHRILPLRRPWLGASAVTSDASPHPVIVHVTPDGPLGAAGARPGDHIVAISKVPVFSGADVETRLRAAETGEAADVGLQTTEGTRNVRITLGSSPLLYPRPIDELPDAIAYTELLLMAERSTSGEELWVIRTNQALILMRARDYEGAVRLLRGLEAPENPHGVGRSTVDYWLALALINAGTTYRDAAVEALRRAAERPGARLEHHDGPWLAPRARARLLQLGAGS